jgi:hypothetical protein
MKEGAVGWLTMVFGTALSVMKRHSHTTLVTTEQLNQRDLGETWHWATATTASTSGDRRLGKNSVSRIWAS